MLLKKKYVLTKNVYYFLRALDPNSLALAGSHRLHDPEARSAPIQLNLYIN